MKIKLILFLILSLCNFAHAGAPETQWVSLTAADKSSGIKVTGKIIAGEGGNRIESARLQGRITNILKREGEVVEVGMPIFDITSAECTSLAEEKRLAQSRNMPEFSEATLRRGQQLSLRVENGDCQLMASSRGTIIRRQVELGATFNVGDPLLTVVDTSHLRVELDVPELALPQVHLRQAVQFHLASLPDKAFHSHVEHILPTVDSVMRTSKVRLDVVSLPKYTTLDSLVFAELVGSHEVGLLRAPIGAFVFSQNQRYVIKKMEPKPVAVAVEVVDESDTWSSIRPMGNQALRVGDQVAVKGAIFIFNQLVGDKPIP